jgi:hypothetical protein
VSGDQKMFFQDPVSSDLFISCEFNNLHRLNVRAT